MKKKINVIGLGYIGLPTALSLAAGHMEVLGTDADVSLVADLSKGRLRFEEKGLPELFEKALAAGISFSPNPAAADVYIVAVPTPYDPYTKKIDPSFVLAALSSLLAVAPRGAVIAVESTISPGTIDRHVRPLIAERGLVCGRDIHLAHVPERIIPGNMIAELKRNNRTIGVDDPAAGELLASVYSAFCEGEMVITSVKVAEMTKVVENTSRDIQIAFANELSRMCRREDIDVYEVIKIANTHPRVNILAPGPGVGGHCISVDPWFLVGDYPDISDLVRAARRVNSGQPAYVLLRVRELMEKNNISDLNEVGFYGLSYKEDVDDVRESPTLQLLEMMKNGLSFKARVYDPLVKTKLLEGQYFDFAEFLSGLKLLVLMVGHRHIIDNADKLSDLVVYDTRHCLCGKNIVSL